jgi:hypothetical protein
LETLFLLLFWAVATFGIGYSLLKLLFYKDWQLSFGEALALSYGIGIAAVSVQMALMSLFGMKFSVSSIMIWWALPIAAAILISRTEWKRRRSRADKKIYKPFSGLEKFFAGAISLEVIYAFFRALIKPMESYDSIAIYALKAKIFYLGKIIPADFFKSFSGFVPHVEYPLLVPLAEAQFYTFFGSLDDLLVKMIFPLYYVALLTVSYSVSRRFLDRKAALFFTFLLATIPQVTDFASNGYADIPFAFYCCASFFYMYLWLKAKNVTMLALSFILSVFAIWTKAEGLMFILINAAVITICMIKERRLCGAGITYALASLCAVIAYIFVWRAIGLSVNSDFSQAHLSLAQRTMEGIRRVPAILYEYQIQFFGPKKWNMVWILFISGFILGFKKVFSKDIFPVTLAIFLVFAGYSAVYMLSSAPQGIGWHLSTSGSRLFIHFVPIVVLWLALMFKELKLEI